MNFRFLAPVFVLFLLSACAGTGNRPDNDAAREQAKINTQLGREYMSLGQYEIALEKLKKAVRFDPNYAPGHTVLAVLYERIKESDLAEKHYLRAIAAAPDNGDVNNNYGVFLCKSGRPEISGKYFIRATNDPFYRTPAVAYANAGSCELQSGNLDKAERYLRQSLEYDAEFADALLSLANVSYLQGEYLRARAFLQRYEGAGVRTSESLALGYRIESGLQNNHSAGQYLDQLLTRFPDSQQAEVLKNDSQ